ncbi:MAG: FHA domain-containing protein [Candidatus Promineofilum sp.]|nr:FHA domain-containing protein [Promineifilum sp.]
MITCPNCQTENQSGKKFCRNCGHPLPADPRATQLSSPLPAGAAGGGRPPVSGFGGGPLPGACPNCGTPIQPNAQFCPVCGHALRGGVASGVMGVGTLIMPKSERPVLVINWPGGQKDERPLDRPVMRLGRAPDNDIVVNFPTVSGHHLRLESDGQAGELKVTDLGSTNGTLHNGLQMPANAPRTVYAGDVLRIGDLTGNSLSLALKGPAGGGVQTRPLGMQQLAQLQQAVIGRDAACEVHLDHPSVSRRHAEIRRQPDGSFVIRDLGSANGTFVDGQRVVAWMPLAKGAVVQIGPYKLVYDLEARALTTSMSRGHRLDTINLGKQVGGGRMILTDVSLAVLAGEFVSLVGGSGAGKSTLLRAMNGFNPATQGQMLIDGEQLYPNLDAYRMIMGYVPQDDIIHRELTVGKALYYAAKLRLPDAGKVEIETRTREVLEMVDMGAHVHKPVRVLSGGQRKRVSIAVELLAQPDLLFLDEPTSGLDPGLEKKMMYDLNRLADRGKTVVLVTHATANIEQCDHVAFLSQGYLSYYGPPGEAIQYFQAQDFADIYLKLTQEVNPAEGKPAPDNLQGVYPAVQARLASAPKAKDGHGARLESGVLWAEHYRQSPQFQNYVAARQQQLMLGAYGAVSSGDRRPPRGHDSGLRQIPILARRQIDLIRNDKRTLFILLLMMPIIALLFMMVSGQYDIVGRPQTRDEIAADLTRDIEDQIAQLEADGELTEDRVNDISEDYLPASTAQQLIVMFGLALTQAGTFGASYEIVKERAIFRRERAVNLRVWSYVIAKALVLGLFAIIQVASVLLILGLKVDMGFDPIFDIFPSGGFELFATLLLAVFASIMFGLFISAIVPSPDVVLYIILVQLFVQIILSGALFPLGDSAGADIASKLVISHWTMDALGSSADLPGLDEDKSVACSATWMPANAQLGTTEPTTRIDCVPAPLGDKLSLDYINSERHLMVTWLALLGMALFWGLMTILVQRRKQVD